MAEEVKLNIFKDAQGWYVDFDHDRKAQKHERITLAPGETKGKALDRFVANNPYYFYCPGDLKIIPNWIKQKHEDYVKDPAKDRFIEHLDLLISKLQSQVHPKIYDSLLATLPKMKESVATMKFQRDPQGTSLQPEQIANYRLFQHVMTYIPSEAANFVFVHEGQHAFQTGPQGIIHWDEALPLKCGDQEILAQPPVPDSNPVYTFEVKLDFGVPMRPLIHDSKANVEYESLKVQGRADRNSELADKVRLAQLTEEVGAYQKESVYLLFSMDYSQKDIEAITSPDLQLRNQAKDDLKQRLRSYLLKEFKHNPKVALSLLDFRYDMLLHYFAVGGWEGNRTLDRFVQNNRLAVSLADN